MSVIVSAAVMPGRTAAARLLAISACAFFAAFSRSPVFADEPRTVELQSVVDGRFSDARKSDALYALGEIYVSRDRTQDALNYYLSSLHYSKSRKRKIRALGRISDVYYAQGYLGKAIEYAKGASALDVRDVALAKKLAAYYAEADLRVHALDEYKKIMARRPGDSEAMFLAAGAYESLGLYSDAAEYYKKAILHGESGRVHLDAARCYEILSHKKTAEALLREYLASHPDYDGFIQLGKLHYTSGEYESAVSAFSSAIKIKPRGKEALLRAGMAYYKSSRALEAAELFKIAAEDYPDCAAARFFLGLSRDKIPGGADSSGEYAAALKLSAGDSILSAVVGAMRRSPRGGRR